ncbi:MAG: hypothetical protein EOO90_02650 [Pedobacter sp.]|nr:MAG: hypothetical protein EOO90_02650 [Pedobacter sp.]
MSQVLSTQIADVQLSELILGTMRLAVEQPDANLAVLRFLHEQGVDTHHVSSEYDTYSSYLALHDQLKQEGFATKHIIKLAAPHFGEKRFDAVSFEERIDRELANLGVEQLTMVQWMFRMEKLDDDYRVKVTSEQVDEIAETFSLLKKKGKVAEFGHFPYSNIYAKHVLDINLNRTVISYLNLFELQDVTLAQQNSFIALRPFAAGRIKTLLENHELINTLAAENVWSREEVKAAIAFFPLLYPRVQAVVCSLNNLTQAKSALKYYEDVKKLQSNSIDFENTIRKMTNFVTRNY